MIENEKTNRIAFLESEIERLNYMENHMMEAYYNGYKTKKQAEFNKDFYESLSKIYKNELADLRKENNLKAYKTTPKRKPARKMYKSLPNFTAGFRKML